MPLRGRRCQPCEGGVRPLSEVEIRPLAAEVPGWSVAGERLRRRFVFHDFAAAMAFVNRVAALAEEEGHHPDVAIHYREVELILWTHAIGGLSENDFILAAKIDGLEA